MQKKKKINSSDYFYELLELKNKKIKEINDNFFTIKFDDDTFITIECAWRLIKDNIIICGDSEYRDINKKDNSINILNEEILEKKIIQINLDENPYDIKILFEGNLKLEILPNSGLYESYTIKNLGKHYVCLPGGDISKW